MANRERRYSKERVLTMWASGMTCKAICTALGMARPEAVSVIVQRARRLGDPRAAARREQPTRRPTLISEETAITRAALDAVTVPDWVPDDFRFLYRVFAKTRGADYAASYVRGRMGAAS